MKRKLGPERQRSGSGRRPQSENRPASTPVREGDRTEREWFDGYLTTQTMDGRTLNRIEYDPANCLCIIKAAQKIGLAPLQFIAQAAQTASIKVLNGGELERGMTPVALR